jgi:hypothetical protein
MLSYSNPDPHGEFLNELSLDKAGLKCKFQNYCPTFEQRCGVLDARKNMQKSDQFSEICAIVKIKGPWATSFT